MMDFVHIRMCDLIEHVGCYDLETVAQAALTWQCVAANGTVGTLISDAYVYFDRHCIRFVRLGHKWYMHRNTHSNVGEHLKHKHGIRFTLVDTEEELQIIANGSLVYTAYKLGVRP